MDQIDIVITWVDNSDVDWKQDYLKYTSKDQQSNVFTAGDNRYQSQSTLKYLFRGIEKYAPWVNHVFFVTYGHLPEWLNTNNDKLIIVKHSDFIPKDYLPTFNSNTILLNLHRIKDLSERFILFNDDMYLTNRCRQTTFFKDGKPRDMAVLNPIVAPNFDPFWDMMLNNVSIINKNFDKRESMNKNIFKWINFKYGIKNNVRNILFYSYRKFSGFYDVHLPNSHLKSVFEEIWSKEYDVCHQTCSHKFRTCDDITEWTMRYWQLASGNFIPINKTKLGVYVSLKDDSYKGAIKKCDKKKYKMICFNDENDDSVFLIDFFESKFKQKSSFER